MPTTIGGKAPANTPPEPLLPTTRDTLGNVPEEAEEQWEDERQEMKISKESDSGKRKCNKDWEQEPTNSDPFTQKAEPGWHRQRAPNRWSDTRLMARM